MSKKGGDALDTERVPHLNLKQYQPLIEILTDPSQSLVKLLSEAIDICDGDKMAKNLFLIFEYEGKTMLLLKEAIAHEIDKCHQDTLLFRNNSICSKLLTVWARLLGLDYLQNAIGDCVLDINNMDESFEVDPNRAKPDANLQANMQKLDAQVHKFFAKILQSYPQCPRQFRQICYYLQWLTKKKFPQAGYFVVAGFFFLRYMCPAIVTPPTYGLLQSFPKKDSHRGLVLVAKILQNLANGVDFKKEPFMEPLNYFLVENQSTFRDFMDRLAQTETPEGPLLSPLNQTPEAQLANLTEMHQFLLKNYARTQEILNSKENANLDQQVFMKLKDVLFELERAEKQDIMSGIKRKDRTESAKDEFLFEISGTEVILNTDRLWSESIRSPVVISIDLLIRAQRLCEDNPTIVVFPSKSVSNPIDWPAIADSIDFSEFVLDTAELQKVDLSKLTNQKEALSFWINVFNIMVIHISVVNGPPSSRSRRKAMSHNFKYDIGGNKYSLDDIVEGILRGNPKNQFKKKDPRIDFCMQQYDPRFHFGISYLTASSPSMRIFKPETISMQLNTAAETFLQDEVTVIEDRKKIKLPYLFEKYYQDFGLYHTDLFRWLSKYLDARVCLEISKCVSTTHYTFEFSEFNWEPRKTLIFARESGQPTRTSADQFLNEFPVETILTFCKNNSEAIPKVNELDDLGVLNLEIKWTGPARPAVQLSISLARHVQGLCQLFLFDWGSIAGSQEFRAFLLATAELQKVELLSLPATEQLAFWINIYNVLIIHLYIMKRPPGEMSMFGRSHFFSTYKYKIAGLEYTLHDIEQGVLRGKVFGRFKQKDERSRYVVNADPRVLFMLSLLTKSSPVVRICESDGLEQLLTKAIQLFIREKVTIDVEKKKVTAPDRVKDLYEKEFNKKKDELCMWMAQFFDNGQKSSMEAILESKKKFSLNFDDLDWTPWPVFDRL